MLTRALGVSNRALVTPTAVRWAWARPTSVTANHWGRTELKFPLHKLPPATTASGFRPPVGGTEALPFKITRTEGQQLPVYIDLKHGGSSIQTIVRKFEGDWTELSQEISALLGGVEVYHRPGRLVVKGHHRAAIKNWLLQLGF